MGKRFKCRQEGCPNFFDEVIGGEGWGAKPGQKSGDCLPCHIAAQIHDTKGATLDSLAQNQQMKEMMLHMLTSGGWTWQDLESAYHRQPPPKVM